MSLTVILLTLAAVILSTWMIEIVGRCLNVEGDVSVRVSLKDGLRGNAEQCSKYLCNYHNHS